MPRLFGYLFYQVQDEATAQELTARSCMHALERLDQYDPARGRLKDWAFGIARNELRQHLRSQRKQHPLIALPAVPEHMIACEGPEPGYDQRETVREVLRHLSHL